MCARERFGEEEQEAAAAAAEEHGCACCGAGAAADPLREGERDLHPGRGSPGWAGSPLQTLHDWT